MNENIVEALNTYIRDSDPGYAVALSGKWGCGKSFFISKWCENILNPGGQRDDKEGDEDAKDGVKDEDFIVLKPVSVSLYGMRCVNDIVKAIDRELYPLLYSKGAKAAKKVLGLLGKVVLRTELDLNNDGKQDVNMSLPLDSLSIFKSGKDIIKGDRLLIFDDFERSYIDTKELMGFINWFVEKANCHVIVIGALDKLENKEKETFEEFREKTIGKLFLLAPDVEAALDCFLNEVPKNSWTAARRDIILKSFDAVECKNLRILRQCIRSFNGILEAIDDFDKDSRFLRGLLASFIIVSVLYHDKNNKDLIVNYQGNYISGLAGNTDKKMRISMLQNRCNPVSAMINYPVLDVEVIRMIVAYLEGTTDMVEFVKLKLKEERRRPSVFEKLAMFENMEDREFESCCGKIEDSLIMERFSKPQEIGRAVDLLCMFDSMGLRLINSSVIEHAENKISTLLDKCNTAEKVYEIKKAFSVGCSMSVMKHELKDNLMKRVDELATARLMNVTSNMQRLLLNLNDRNVGKLEMMDKQPAPDKNSAFQLTSIFAGMDAGVVFKALRKMTNRNRNVFNSFLRNHYDLDTSVLHESPDRFAEDIVFLFDMKTLVDNELKSVNPGPTSLSYEKLAVTLSDIIGKIDPSPQNQ